MPMICMETFEQSGLDVLELDIKTRAKALNASFTSNVIAEEGFFGRIEGVAETMKSQTGWSDEIVEAISSPEEFKVLREAGLTGYDIGGKKLLVSKDINWNQLDDFGRTNVQRVESGLNPLAQNGKPYEWHHIGQGKNAPLALVTSEKHDLIPNLKTESEIDRTAFTQEKRQINKALSTDVVPSAFSLAVKAGHETGVKTGLTAAGITAAISTVDNIRGVMSGEITAQEAFVEVAEDTGTAAAIGYGTGFISSAVASATHQSGHALIRTLGSANVTGAVISFGIDSYDSVVDYAQGEISGQQLAYDLGESASGVAGAMAGGASVGAVAGSVVPVVGTVAGGLVGGMIGYAVATGAYATAVEVATGGTEVLVEKAEAIVAAATETAAVVGDIAADVYAVSSSAVVDAYKATSVAVSDAYEVASVAVVKNAEVLRDKAVEMGRSVIASVAAAAPEALGTVTTAMNDFTASLNLPIHF